MTLEVQSGIYKSTVGLNDITTLIFLFITSHKRIQFAFVLIIQLLIYSYPFFPGD